MKIAEVTSTFPPYKAGIGNIAYHNAWLLSRLGHEVTVFTPRQSFFIKHIDEYPFQVKRLYPWFKYGNAGILPQYYINYLNMMLFICIILFLVVPK